jgi:hypothetical protein
MTGNLIPVFISLTLANFAVQFFGQELYSVALERSYFQGVALFILWLSVKIKVEPNDEYKSS